MAKFQVSCVVGASVGGKIEAETVSEALEKAWDDDRFSPGLCHQCSRRMDIGDIIETHVYDENDNEVYTDARDNNEDIRALAAYLKGKRVPKHIRAIVERWS